MVQTTCTTEDTAVGAATFWLMVRAFAVLRIFTGLVFLTNGLAEVTGTQNVDWGFLSFTLITRDGAKGIAGGAADSTYIAPLGAFYRDVVLPNWGFFGVFLTLAELAVGLGLIFGVATRLAAVGGLLLIAPSGSCNGTPGSTCGSTPPRTSCRWPCSPPSPPDASPASTPASPPASTTAGPSNPLPQASDSEV